MADVSFSGGKKLESLFKNAGKGGVKGVDVGVFANARYPDGTLVAAVAAWNEFGTTHGWGTIQERPALRNANKNNEKILLSIIKRHADPKTMVITPKIAGFLGESHEGAMKKSIVALRSPANEASTIKAKKSSNPLIGKHGLYEKSITHKVIR